MVRLLQKGLLCGLWLTLQVFLIGPLSPSVGQVRLIFRNEVFRITPTGEMTFRDALQVATPIRCFVVAATVWDVSAGAEVALAGRVPLAGGEFHHLCCGIIGLKYVRVGVSGRFSHPWRIFKSL